MSARSRYVYKRADQAWEFEAIHRLNYATFVEEIPQHAPNESRRLIDRFHDQNEYVIALATGDGGECELAAMVAVRMQRPFSLDSKVAHLDRWLRPDCNPCEVRLLAVAREHRGSRVLTGLLGHAIEFLRAHGRDCALASGTTRQLELYRHLGFEPFGSLVGTPGAQFQPMRIELDRFLVSAPSALVAQWRREHPLRFLPGPVTVAASTHAAFASDPMSHRSGEFESMLARVRHSLCRGVRASDAQVMVGSATLANDVVALELAASGARGLVAVNGEFGERLVDHARRAGADFDALRVEWGEAFDERVLERHAERAGARWLWATHCETSTAVLNDLAMLRRVAARRGLALALDCTSSVGVVPLDLSDVAFATCGSGKGIASYPGLAIVFHGALAERSTPAPRYLDLRYWRDHRSVPFTHSSNLVAALEAALVRAFELSRNDQRVQRMRRIRAMLERAGFATIAPEARCSPGVVTFAPPRTLRASRVALALERQGIALSWRSDYLRRRGWLQIALMGEHDDREIDELLLGLERVASIPSRSASAGAGA